MKIIRQIETRRSAIIIVKFMLATAASLYFALLYAPLAYLSCGFIAVLSSQPNLYKGIKLSLEQVQAATVAAVITIITASILRLSLEHDISIIISCVSMGLTVGICFKFVSTWYGKYITQYLKVLKI